MEIAVVYFDLGKVLLDFKWEEIIMSLTGGREDAPEEVIQFLVSTGLLEAYEKGDIPSEDFFGPLMEHLQFTGPMDDFKNHWNNIFHPIETNIQILEEVCETYPAGLISNLNESHMEYVEQNYDFLGNFILKTYSHMVGMRKPEKGIYESALEGLGFEPGEAIFIDDMIQNVEGARAHGMKAIHFTPETNLRRLLVAEGVRINPTP